MLCDVLCTFEGGAMQRRSFLKAVAAAAPAAGLQTFLVTQARSQTPASPPPSSLHVLGAGEDRFGHPHSLGFSSILFKVPTSETAGGLFVMEHTHLLQGGPPLHLHLNQEEWFYVMEGEVAFQVGEQRLQLHAGESVLAPRRVPHTFSSVGATPSRLLIAFCPAGKMEQYFRDAENAKESAGDAEFMRRYEMELVGPSSF
jgi:mannose-6-phosphate isomerase-like protein (cupin superfamily)